MVPGYKWPFLPAIPNRCLIPGGFFLDTPTFCGCPLVQLYHHPICLNISKVSVTVISKHQNTVRFSNVRITLPSESSKTQQRVLGEFSCSVLKQWLSSHFRESHIFGYFGNLWTKHPQARRLRCMGGRRAESCNAHWGTTVPLKWRSRSTVMESLRKNCREASLGQVKPWPTASSRNHVFLVHCLIYSILVHTGLVVLWKQIKLGIWNNGV